MKPDPIVEEIRAGRTDHAKRFDFDVAKIAADYRNLQQNKYKDRIQVFSVGKAQINLSTAPN